MNYKLTAWIKRNLKPFIINSALIILVVAVVSWIQTLNMLETGKNIEDSQIELIEITGLKKQVFDFKQRETDTLVYFFAPWCSVCHLSIDNLEAVHNDQNTTQIIAIALDYQSETEVRDFIAQHELSFPVYLGNEEVKQKFKISAYPSYYVVTNQAEVRSKVAGYTTELGILLRL
ncbi:thioredoxin-like domain-containing protein [Catenovulum maritimum]|uniref:thioredoxin-like domain-containing protein n=1 Tax=Catenovulum maritimum TaxID=1513271 RepID=UPI00069F7741|nr:thioredoxin-like domain-containing protein [Catenovulum maritimum]